MRWISTEIPCGTLLLYKTQDHQAETSRRTSTYDMRLIIEKRQGKGGVTTTAGVYMHTK